MISRKALAAHHQQLRVEVRRLNADAARELLATTAAGERDRVLREQGARSGVAPSYRQVVDGKEGAALRDVRPDGVIVFEWQYLQEVAQRTFEMLLEAAPEVSGDYKKGLQIQADGVPVTVESIPAGARIIEIIATEVYARRLEVGKRENGQPFVINAKPHFVEKTALAARRLFGNMADVGYFMAVEGGKDYQVGGGLSERYHDKRGKFRRRNQGRAMTWPAIRIEGRGLV